MVLPHCDNSNLMKYALGNIIGSIDCVRDLSKPPRYVNMYRNKREFKSVLPPLAFLG